MLAVFCEKSFLHLFVAIFPKLPGSRTGTTKLSPAARDFKLGYHLHLATL